MGGDTGLRFLSLAGARSEGGKNPGPIKNDIMGLVLSSSTFAIERDKQVPRSPPENSSDLILGQGSSGIKLLPVSQILSSVTLGDQRQCLEIRRVLRLLQLILAQETWAGAVGS